ncbi:MAG: alpha/beta fold hydrolase [Pseudomonadota bacterium]
MIYLIEHRERVVSRGELLDNVWKGKVVSDSALGARVRDVRKVLNDSGERQRVIKTVHGRGYQFIADVKVESDVKRDTDQCSDKGPTISLSDQSTVKYCRSRDGVKIAHTHVGKGPPLVVTGSWMTHLKEDWNNPNWGPYLNRLAQSFKLIRYDQRGNGMSDWNDVNITFENMVADLEAVIDSYSYDKVAVFGPSQAASVSLAFARQYPGKVSTLILHGGYARGRKHRGYPGCEAESDAIVTLIRQSWASDNPSVRHAYTSLMMPDASQSEFSWFNEFQKKCGPAENIARFREMFDDIDIVDILGDIKTPTLVAHNLGDSVAPIAEGKILAQSIPGAELVTFDSDNHMMFEDEPEFGLFIDSVKNFILGQK